MTTTPSDPNQAPGLTPEGLANQLFDVAISQAMTMNQTDPREAARRVIIFLTEALVYAISATAGDDTARKALLENVGKTIISAPPPGTVAAGKP